MLSSGKLRFELVLTRWEDGLFKSLDRILADSTESLEKQFEFLITEVHKKMADEADRRYKIADDDDIPFRGEGMNIRKRFRHWFYNQTYKLVGLNCGPVMLNMRGEYLFIDGYGAMWRVTPTMDPHMPLIIQLQVKP